MMADERRVHRDGLLGLVFGRQANYVRRLVPLYILCLMGFFFSLVVGYEMGGDISTSVREELMEGLPDFRDFDITIALLMYFLFIVFNNVAKSFLFMVLGIIGSFPPLYFSIMNGFILGNVSYAVALERSLPFTVAALLPHGIIEVPTILLSSAAGMGLGYQLINRFRGRGGLGVEFSMALRLFVTRIIPLLFLAAVVEVTLTPLLVVFLGFA